MAPAMMNGLSSIKSEFAIGSRIEVKPSVGPRLGGKTGTVIGLGYHPKSLRIVLDGSRSPITLHFTYLLIVNSSAPGSTDFEASSAREAPSFKNALRLTGPSRNLR